MSSAFEQLARPVQKWIRGKGWRELRDIQARAIHAMNGSSADLIIAASTAGGKTEAAFLPLISEILKTPSDKAGFDILYIAPLKALITDQAGRLDDLCDDTGLPVVPWHGDIAALVKTRALKAPRGTLMITPESLEALFVRRNAEIARLFGATRAIVLDELHTILDSERGVQVRSLLARLERSVGRSIRRVGLSATLGDMDMAQIYLRPDAADTVQVIEAKGAGGELFLQLKGYVTGAREEGPESVTDRVAGHLFENLRGSNNLVFAGARGRVEIYADRLRTLCETEHLPQEFYPHHASLSREHRDFVERRLKDPSQPTTTICTSTLELGIDIGDVTCVAQIGAPFSVSALRQRLGRSGRRPGQPAILRQYAVEFLYDPSASLSDRMRLGLIRAIAMIELLLERWCEPPRADSLHLSTLVHQILSIIAGRGGASAQNLYKQLCLEGPFRQVSMPIFIDVLRAIGRPEIALIEQSTGGLLLLGKAGEQLVEHYSFYAVFPTPEEFTLIAQGKPLGTIPLDNMLAPGMMLIFSGRRWTVQEVDTRDKVILVTPSKGGNPPVFGGDPGIIHDRVIEKMHELLTSDYCPRYMDEAALELLREARESYCFAGFGTSAIVRTGEDSSFIETVCGTVKNSTLALALRGFGHEVEQYDGFLEVYSADADLPLQRTLEALAGGADPKLFAGKPNLIFEKFHPFLPDDLLQQDALSTRLDVECLPRLCLQLTSAGTAVGSPM